MRVGCVTVGGLIVDDGAVLIEPEHFSWCVRASSLSSENEPNGYVSPSWTSMIFADVQRGLDTLEEVSLVSWLRIVSFYAPHCEHRHRLSGRQSASTSSSPCEGASTGSRMPPPVRIGSAATCGLPRTGSPTCGTVWALSPGFRSIASRSLPSACLIADSGIAFTARKSIGRFRRCGGIGLRR